MSKKPQTKSTSQEPKRTHKKFYIGVSMVLAFVATLGIIGFDRTIETEIKIDASAEKVWDVLLDFEKHKDWNPFIKSIEGEPIVGSSLKITVQAPTKDPMTFEPVVLNSQYKKELRWKGRFLMPGIFDGEHYFNIQDNGDGSVTFIHGEHFSGILIPVFGGGFNLTQQGFEMMNKALKERVEK